MERVIKDYLPKIEPMEIETNSKDFRKKWDIQIKIEDVEVLTLLR